MRMENSESMYLVVAIRQRICYVFLAYVYVYIFPNLCMPWNDQWRQLEGYLRIGHIGYLF